MNRLKINTTVLFYSKLVRLVQFNATGDRALLKWYDARDGGTIRQWADTSDLSEWPKASVRRGSK